MATPVPPQPTPPLDERGPETERERADSPDEHEKGIEEREAYEYWGYLFKQDKTGTDKLKSLLRGLKASMNEHYEPSDQPDLTPGQLASFYRDMHGDYDKLFLSTPHESIAFIYKSLGCLHSLQPPAFTHAQAFNDPTVPALKTEGWIMWQTIQLLLGPDEHADFIREAVAHWDVRDQDTGDLFPKVLPRQCFPLEPDKHMVAWYEGVSERLRKEAEEEERRHTEIEVHHDPPPRRIHGSQVAARREGDVPTDDEGSVDSRGRALAYFQNPLYRHVDGRPGIVRRNSKRPTVSPRQTMMGKGKEAAHSFGRIARNVGSPHLWDGRKASSSRDRSRRRSHPESHHHYPDERPAPSAAGSYDNRYSPRDDSGHGHHRRRSAQLEPEKPAAAAAVNDDDWDAGDEDPVYSPQPRRSTPSGNRPTSRHEYRDQGLRHSKSHEPTPTQQQEGADYFEGVYDDPQQRRNSSHEKPYSPPTPNGLGPSFGPSASPLFASHVAKQPQGAPPRSHAGPAPAGPDAYQGGPPLRNPSIRRAQGRYPSRSPEPGSRPPPPMDPRDRERDRRYDSPLPSRTPPGRGYGQSPAPYEDMGPGPGGPPGPPMGSKYGDHGPQPPRDHRDRGPRDRDPRDRDHRDRGSRDRGSRDRDPRDRRSNRMSAPDLDRDPYYSGEDGRRSRPKQTRFADTGVSGRRYADESPWDERRRS